MTAGFSTYCMETKSLQDEAASKQMEVFSDDKKMVCIRSVDGILRILNTTIGKEVLKVQGVAQITCVSFINDNKMVCIR